jgi:serine/threonine protein kinase
LDLGEVDSSSETNGGEEKALDGAKAELLAEQLIGTQLDSWTIEHLVNHGKSAAVFSARKGGQLAAVKIFDTELIERYGDHAQLGRIERELELRGQSHENLVSIYGGGHDKDKNLYFIVMEYLDGQNLKDSLQAIETDSVPSLIGQLAGAAKFLEDRGLVHRDIKPENIAILDGGRRLVLLDLGVVRPIKGSDLTDPEGIHAFVGTLQYSSPEFLLREEKQDIDGWRALTFYQIGAVLHDLLVRRPLFEQFANPYAKLVNAVQHERPTIINPDAPSRLIQLAQRCLLKNPKTRLKVVRWEDFFHQPEAAQLTSKDRVAERLVTVRAQSDETAAISTPTAQQVRTIRQNVLNLLKSAATTARASVVGLPPIRNSRCPDDDDCVDFEFNPRSDQGFPHGLVVRVKVEIVDAKESVITCAGIGFFKNRLGGYPGTEELSTTWFEGTINNSALNKSFESFLFEAIEWCLQISPGVESNCVEVYRPRNEGQ